MTTNGNQDASKRLALWIACGVAVGAVAGIVWNNLAMGVGVGAALGVALFLASGGRGVPLDRTPTTTRRPEPPTRLP